MELWRGFKGANPEGGRIRAGDPEEILGSLMQKGAVPSKGIG